MTTPLPDAPSLEQLKNRAKDLRRAHQARDPQAALRVRRHLPGLGDAELSVILDRALPLAEAQLIVAREHGFPSWPRLKKHLDALAPDPVVQFQDGVRASDAGRVQSLLRRFPSLRRRINEPLFDFDSPAVHAAKNNPALMDVLLRYGADINARSQWWAGGFGVLDATEPDVAVFLIARGARIDAHAAAGLGMLDRLREIIEADPNVVHARGGDGQTPLHVARTSEIASYLLDRGADRETRDLDHAATPAQYAVGDRPDVCRLLLSRGAQDDIFMRCVLGDLEEVRSLVEANPALLRSLTVRGPHAPVPAPGEHIYNYTLGGEATPLMVAAGRGLRDMAALLLDLGADVNARDALSTALHHAAWSGRLEMIDFLLERGADRDCPDTLYRSTPAGWAAHNGQGSAKDLLLKEAGIIDAAGFGLLSRVQTLTDRDPILVDGPTRFTGARPLHWSLRGGHLDVARLLLERGAHPNLTTGDGKTALATAQEVNSEEASALLRAQGAV